MILPGKVTKVKDNGEYEVGLVLFDGDGNGNRVCTACTMPYFHLKLNEGDPIYALCVNGNPNNPIIIGTLPLRNYGEYQKMDVEVNDIQSNSLKVTEKAELPLETYLNSGKISFNVGTILQGLTKMFKGLNEGTIQEGPQPVYLKKGINYGTSIPEDGEDGQIFFLIED